MKNQLKNKFELQMVQSIFLDRLIDVILNLHCTCQFTGFVSIECIQLDGLRQETTQVHVHGLLFESRWDSGLTMSFMAGMDQFSSTPFGWFCNTFRDKQS